MGHSTQTKELLKIDALLGALCPICGKSYTFRKGHEDNNPTCPSRTCKDKYQSISVLLRCAEDVYRWISSLPVQVRSNQKDVAERLKIAIKEVRGNYEDNR